MRNSSNEAPTQRGWEVGLELLPLFDWGGARVARAEAVYMQTVHRASQTALNARTEVREAYAAYRSACDIARFQHDEVMPLNQRIAEENVLRYNGMLIGVFELLADARPQITSVHSALQALRDFWSAQADLDMALIGKPSLMLSRRMMLGASATVGAITAAVAAVSVSKMAMAALPEPVLQTRPDTMPPLVPSTGRPYNPVVTINGWTLPWRMNQGV